MSKLDAYGKEIFRRDLPDVWMAAGFGRDGSVALSVSIGNADADFGCGLTRAPVVVKLAPDGSCQWQRTLAAERGAGSSAWPRTAASSSRTSPRAPSTSATGR